MTTVLVFDPAMCCSSGVCGTSVDPQLARFSADLDWLASQGVAVERFNLAQQPGAFVADDAVKAALERDGEAGLPLVKVDGEVKSSGEYPSRARLAGWAGVSAPASEPTPKPSGCCGPSAEPSAETSAKTSAEPAGCC